MLGCTIVGIIVSVPEFAPTLEWSKTYGPLSEYGDHHAFISATPDGGYIAGGVRGPYREFWVVKTDVAGNTQWNKTWTGYPSESAATHAIGTSDGGYALAGYTFDSVYLQSAVLIKVDSKGVQQWNRTFGSFNYAQHVEQTADSGYVMAGGWGTWLAKTDVDGTLQWNRTYTGGELCFVHQVGDGGYVAAGTNGSYPLYQSDFLLLKTSPNGDIEWRHTYKHGIVNIVYSASETFDGGYIIAGTTEPYSENARILVLKTDGQGNVLWKQVYGDDKKYHCNCIRQTSDGGYALVGVDFSNYIPLMIKIDRNGAVEWTKRSWEELDELGANSVRSLTQSSDGGYVIAGSISSGDLFIAKLTSEVTVKQGPALLFGTLVVSGTLESILLIGLTAVGVRKDSHNLLEKSSPQRIIVLTSPGDI